MDMPDAQSLSMSKFVRKVLEGDDHERLVCPSCGHIVYENPNVVVGSLVVEGDRVLLCKRAIAPRRGYWTLPAGYQEMGETLEEGACREVLEEAQARISLDGILAIYSISQIGQVQILFRGHFDGPPSFAAGPESEAVALFAWDEIPWDSIAFPSIEWALHAWHRFGPGPLGRPHTNPPNDPRGTAILPAEAPEP